MQTNAALKQAMPIAPVVGPKLAYKQSELLKDLLNKDAEMAVVGLGYVGLPLAVHMASTFKVTGFDINSEKVMELALHRDPCEELATSDFENKDITFSFNESNLADAKMYIVAVPTPIDSNKTPDLTPLKKATATVARHLKKGDCVVFESTVYPGCTEEICVPILQRISRLKFNEDFTVGYSPERINPGDKKHTFTQITKVVSGSTDEALELIAGVYDQVVEAGVHKAASLKVAEASKIVENIQRDVNIGLMNELNMIFSTMDVPMKDVLKAAGTKWNFQNYFPGLVGGHCIGVDPYYLIDRAHQFNCKPAMLEQARKTNEGMIEYIAKKIVRHLGLSKPLNKSRILIKGITFKEDVNDIRNSKIAEVAQLLQSKGCKVVVEDPYAKAHEVKREYKLDLYPAKQIEGSFDVVVMAVNHSEYQDLKPTDIRLNAGGFVLDVRGTFQHLAEGNRYETL